MPLQIVDARLRLRDQTGKLWGARIYDAAPQGQPWSNDPTGDARLLTTHVGDGVASDVARNGALQRALNRFWQRR